VASRVLLIGANGQLGTDIALVLAADPSFDCTGLVHDDLELLDAAAVAGALREHRPDIVINTAAFHNLDRCEEEQAQAYAVNASAVKELARACAEADATLVHFSTDYVFGGPRETPWPESEPPCPLNVYGISKAAGEMAAAAYCPKHYVLRVSGLYGRTGPRGKGVNFPELMIRLATERGELKVVDDQRLTPTSTASIAARLPELFGRVPYGTWNFTDEGECSWFEFAAAVIRLAGVTATMVPVKTGFFGEKTQRPGYSVLSKDAIRRHLPATLFPHWEDALARYIEARRPAGPA
jgi:dTDP-4-dehydrorhamnose reductase